MYFKEQFTYLYYLSLEEIYQHTTGRQKFHFAESNILADNERHKQWKPVKIICSAFRV